MTKALSFPYVVSPAGVASYTESPTKIYLDRVLTLFSYYVGQRPMLPTYGVDWSGSLFENDDNARIAIPAALKSALSKWIPEVTITSVEFLGDPTDGTENVVVSLRLPDDTLTSLTINTGTIDYTGTVTR
jgi:phage baseplate assembly protein W